MAIQAQPSAERVSDYNYTTFTPSDTRGKTDEFKHVARVGEPAPDFDLPALDGGRVRLSSFRGAKHVLLEFGAIT